MSTFQDLARRADSLATPAIDVDALIARGEQRLRRRRVTAVATAAAVVVATIVGGVLVDRGARESNAPIHQPNRHDRSPAPTTPKVRPLVYADGLHGTSIHYGSKVVKTGIAFTHIDVTDDGFVYSTGRGPLAGYRGDGRLWFSDGGTPVQIGSHACEAAHGFANTAVTANTGSRIAWLECTSDPLQSLVVFDTSSMKEVVRRPLPPCERNLGGECTLEALVGRHVYLADGYTRRPDGPLRTRGLVLDLDTSSLTQVSPADQRDADATDTQAYIVDAGSLTRGLLVGMTMRTARPTDGIGLNFSVARGRRLVPQVWLPDAGATASEVWSIATGRTVHLRLPNGDDFPGRPDDYQLFEWLDDDNVALIAGGGGWATGRGQGDLLTCRLSDGHCVVSVHGPADAMRVVPHVNLPG
jgi:hypothetical protein